jgi:ESS family glutamate:Na+ symporter
MQSWQLNITLGAFFLDIALMATLLVVATFLRRYGTVFQRYLVPNNIIAGFLGMFIAMLGFGFPDIDSSRMGAYVYHLLALLFIAFGLRKPHATKGNTPLKFSIIFIICYLVQGIAGLSLAFLLIHTIMPDLFPGIGMLMPLAFGMNPGIAFTIGQNWEAHGFADGGTVGLSFAAIGFLIAYSVGIWTLRRGILRGEAHYIKHVDSLLSESVRTGLVPPAEQQSAGKSTTSSEVIESMSWHVSIIGLTYGLTYALCSVLEQVLVHVGAENEIATLWSFHFILAAILAMFVRRIIDATGVAAWIDDATMTRTGNLFMDFMVVASISAITVAVVTAYWIPLLILSTVVGLLTWVTIRLATDSLFKQFRLERYLAIFGNMTGTMQSALVLLRVLDPKFASPVSQDLVYGSGMALALGFPLLVLINAPVNYFDNSTNGYIMTLIGMVVYLSLLLGAWSWLKRSEGQK